MDFEAKGTASKTSFPFTNIHPHQIKHLKLVKVHGGIGFFIIRFRAFGETYLVDAPLLIARYEEGRRKSIPYEEVKRIGSLIREGLAPRLHYLDSVDALYFKEESHEEEQRK